jgi:hypothetical protein
LLFILMIQVLYGVYESSGLRTSVMLSPKLPKDLKTVAFRPQVSLLPNG